ncbi:MAG: CAP domain-containing protein [Flavobacterium sp.]
MKSKLLNVFMPMVLVLAMGSCSHYSNEEIVTADKSLITNYEYSTEETQLLQMINDYRVSNGLNALITINHISYKSMEHNDYMITKNVVNHDFFAERAQNLMDVLGAYKVGENVAYNFSCPTNVLNAWLNSPTHKANLDGNYTHFGLSISINPITGKKYYTNMFIKK